METRHRFDQVQSNGRKAFLSVAMGLLPCPLIIIVVGSAIYRGAALAGIVLAVGINIGCFGLLGITPRRGGLALLGGNIHRVLKGLAYLELLTSLPILTLGLFTVAGVVGRGR